MHFDAFIRRERKQVLADFSDCPGCQTFADGADELAGAAKEALEGWLEAHLVSGQVPPRPKARTRAPAGAKLLRVPVRAWLSAALGVRWARQDAGLTQAELDRRVPGEYQAVPSEPREDRSVWLEDGSVFEECRSAFRKNLALFEEALFALRAHLSVFRDDTS